MAEGIRLSALEATGFSLTWRVDTELTGLQIKCSDPHVPFFQLHTALSAAKLFPMSQVCTHVGSGPASPVLPYQPPTPVRKQQSTSMSTP